MFAFLLRGGKWWEQMKGKVPSILEWVESLLPMQRSKDKQETGSDISILKHGIISLLNIHILLPLYWVSLVVQIVKNMPAIWETWVQSLWVEKILWRWTWQPTPIFLPGQSPWTEEPGGLQSMGLTRVRHNWVTKHNTFVLLYVVSRISRVIPYN